MEIFALEHEYLSYSIPDGGSLLKQQTISTVSRPAGLGSNSLKLGEKGRKTSVAGNRAGKIICYHEFHELNCGLLFSSLLQQLKFSYFLMFVLLSFECYFNTYAVCSVHEMLVTAVLFFNQEKTKREGVHRPYKELMDILAFRVCSQGNSCQKEADASLACCYFKM